jgi:hypothetical protein
MLRFASGEALTGNVARSAERRGELLQVTEQRLIRYGCTEREACALANVVTLERDTPDAVVEQAVIEALVNAKHAVDGVADIEYLGGQRRDTLRLEGR